MEHTIEKVYEDLQLIHFGLAESNLVTVGSLLAVYKENPMAIAQLIKGSDVTGKVQTLISELPLEHNFKQTMLQEFDGVFSVKYTNALVSVLLSFENLVQQQTVGQLFDALVTAVGSNSRGFSITPNAINELAIHYLSADGEVSFHDGTAGFGQTAMRFAQAMPHAHIALQEINSLSATVARLRMYLSEREGKVIEGNLITNPGFTNDGVLIQYDRVFMAPPLGMRFGEDVYEMINKDPYGRFTYGTPPRSQSDSVFLSCGLSATKEDGKAAFLLSPGALFRSGPEKDIRQRLIDLDLIEAVISLPSLLQPYTAIKPVLLLCNKNKPEQRKGKILMVNAEDLGVSNKREVTLSNENIALINEIISNGQEIEGISKFVDSSAIKAAQLTPSNYVFQQQTQLHEVGEVMVEMDALNSIVTKPLAELVKIYRGYNASPKDEAENGEYAVVKISDVQDSELNVNDLTRYSITNNAKIEANRIQQGDILLSVRGVNRKAALFTSNRDDVLLSQNFAGIRCGELVDPEFLMIYFESPVAQYYFEKHTVGTTIATLAVKDLGQLPVPLLPLNEQRKLVETYKAEQQAIKEQLAQLQVRQTQLKLQAYETMGIDKAFTIL